VHDQHAFPHGQVIEQGFQVADMIAQPVRVVAGLVGQAAAEMVRGNTAITARSPVIMRRYR